MLETEIKNLTTAVEALTAVLQTEVSNIATGPELAVDNDRDDAQLDIEDITSQPVAVTKDELRNLAKHAIKRGADRSAIKLMISKYGAETITDLSPDDRTHLAGLLEAM